jgi:hypothetical protein
MLRALAVAVVFLSSVAFADESHIAIQPIKGAKGAALQKQLKKSLCKSFTCVKPGKDEDVSVDAVVVAKVTGTKLAISVYYDEDENPVTAKVALKKGKLSSDAINAAESAVRQAIDSHSGAVAHAD